MLACDSKFYQRNLKSRKIGQKMRRYIPLRIKKPNKRKYCNFRLAKVIDYGANFKNNKHMVNKCAIVTFCLQMVP